MTIGLTHPSSRGSKSEICNEHTGEGDVDTDKAKGDSESCVGGDLEMSAMWTPKLRKVGVEGQG